jgi:GT2 family glycosyltransferase
MVFILIPVHNRIDKTIKCLDSIVRQSYEKIQVIVIDDGSSDNTKLIIQKAYPEVEILNGTGSMFWTGAVSFGINYVLRNCSKDDWILLVNNDVQMEDTTLKRLVVFAEEMQRRVIVNALSVDNKDKDTIIKSGTIVNSWLLNITKHLFHGESLNSLSSIEAIEVDLLTGRCLLHPVEVFNDIGNYNSEYFPHYGGDDDYSARAKKFGYKLFILPSAVVYLDNKKEDLNESLTDHFFGIRSSSNLINKWKFSITSAPKYSVISFFLIGVLKSIFIFIKNKINL